MSDTSLTETPSSAAPSAGAVLLALADRCEREEPSAELDARIHAAINGFVGPEWDVRFTRSCLQYTAQKKGELQQLLYCEVPFTTSLDSAVTLAPPRFEWRDVSQHTDNHGMWYATLMAIKQGPIETGRGKTEAMARCAAALRARAALVQS